MAFMAQEQLVTMQMHVTDPDVPPTDAANSVTYVVTTDAWIAPDPPEVKEIQLFDKRFGEKLMAGVDFSAWKAQMTNSNPAMSQMFSGQPGSQDAMAQMAKEMAKLQGTRVMEVTSMGGEAGPGREPPRVPARQLRLLLRTRPMDKARAIRPRKA